MSFLVRDTLDLLQNCMVERDALCEFLKSNESCFNKINGFEFNLNGFFSWLRKRVFSLISYSSKIANLNYYCLELKYHMFWFLSDYLSLFDELNELGEDDCVDFSLLIKHISDLIIFIGNFNVNFNENLLDNFECCEKSIDDNDCSLAFHSILTIISSLYFLVYNLEKQQLIISDCSYQSIFATNVRRQIDKPSLFMDMSYYFIYNLSVLNLNWYQKRIDLKNCNLCIDNFLGFPCECIKKNWLFIENLLETYKPNSFSCVSAHVALLLDESSQSNIQRVSNKLYFGKNDSHSSVFLIMLQRCLAELATVGKMKVFKDMITYENFKLIKSIVKELSTKTSDEILIKKDFFAVLFAIYEITTKFSVTSLGIKCVVDLLSYLWENYFCKQLNELRTLDFNCLCFDDIKYKLNSIEATLNQINYEFNPNSNLFHFYLKLLAINIKDDQAWRLFKGRLYTRLHDKRIQELNLNAILNVSYLFLTLVRCISQPIEPAQNLHRILSIFQETHLGDEKCILNSNNFHFKNHQINFILRLALLDSIQSYLSNSNDQDHKSFGLEVSANLTDQINSFLKSHKVMLEEAKRTLNFKISQNENENLCEMFKCYITNVQQFLAANDQKLLDLYGIGLLEAIDVEYILANLKQSQCESIFNSLIHLFECLQNNKNTCIKLNAYASNLTKIIFKYLTKNQHSNSTVQAIDLYFQICMYLSFQPKSSVLDELLEKIFSSVCHTQAKSDCLLPKIRLEFASKILENANMLQTCKKMIANFELKMFSLALNYYLTHDDHKDDDLLEFLRGLFEKLQLFNQYNVTIDSNVENIFIDFIFKVTCRLKLIENFQDRKHELDSFIQCIQDLIKMINNLSTITSHSTIYKCYLIASQIISNCSLFIYSRGRSDTLFAQIIDKMVLPRFMSSTTTTTTNSISTLSLTNLQNSVWLSLKDFLPLFLNGISNLNYEYDSYLQRVLRSIISNYTMKYQMSQLDEHFILLTVHKTFGTNVVQEDKSFRNYLLKIFKEVFIQESRINSDTEKILALVQLICDKTEIPEVNQNDLELFLPCIVELSVNENILLKSKAIILFERYLKNPNIFQLNEALDNFINQNWNRIELSKSLGLLSMIAKLGVNLIGDMVKQTLVTKVLETQSKFIHNTEHKNILKKFLDLVDSNDELHLRQELGL